MPVRVALLLLAACVPLADVLFAAPQGTPAPKPRKVAFLVGVGAFKHDLDDLKGSPQKDVAALAKVLGEGGFEVVVLKDADATKANIEKRFAALLAGDGDAAKAIDNKDLLLVAVCTHGFTLPPAEGKPDTPFLAAHDSKLDQPDTMVPLNGLIDAAKASGATALYLIDACREMRDVNRGQKRGVEGAAVSLPKQTAILFSCRRGQVAHQNEKADGHGLFTWAVLNALRTEAGPKDDVSWTELVAGVQKSFRSAEFRAMIPAGKPQVPVLAVGGEFDDAHLMTVKPGDDPKAGDVRTFEVERGVFMEFCWIPATTAAVQLGSPKAEQDYLTKTFLDGKRPGWLDDESETARPKFTTRGFWLGKDEVTQHEWEKVMGSNPSYFVPAQETVKKAGIGDTSKFPVEQVSWDDIQPFLTKLNGRPVAKTAFGKAGKFVLPHEDEWEYACRGGKGSTRAFYWGDVLNGTQANCDGSISPYGTADNGAYLQRTCAVDDTNGRKYEKHPWGLRHMHGNVWEWCENKYKQSDDSCVVRGGSWYDVAGYCRAASRYWLTPGNRYGLYGFRVAFRLDP